MKSTLRVSAAVATAACALALAACSAEEGIPGVPGLGRTPGPAVTFTERGPEPCGGSGEAYCTPPPETSQAPTTAATPTDTAATTTLAPTTPATTPAPSTTATSPSPTSTEKSRAYGLLYTDDKNKYIDSKVPFIAGVVTRETRAISASYAFERMDVDYKCPGTDAPEPENGHFVRVFYFLSNSKADRATGPTLDVTAHTWRFLDEDGTPWMGNLVTRAALSCSGKTSESWGGTAKPGWIASGTLVFDVPSTSGILQHTFKEGIGGWRFPVENANTNFRSLDERVAENFGK